MFCILLKPTNQNSNHVVIAFCTQIKMFRKKKSKKLEFDKPKAPTIKQMIEDVEGADPNDYVFKFVQQLDEDNEKSEICGDNDDSDDDFYDVRESFEIDPTFKYETTEQRYESMQKLMKIRSGLMKTRQSMDEHCKLLKDETEEISKQISDLKIKVKENISKHHKSS